MIRRKVVMSANILWLCAVTLHIVLRYGRIVTSAPDWIVFLEAAVIWLPILLLVNIIGAVWKRIDEKISVRPFLTVVTNTIVVAVSALQCFFVVAGGDGLNAMVDILLTAALALLAVNIGNVIWKMAEKKKAN